MTITYCRSCKAPVYRLPHERTGKNGILDVAQVLNGNIEMIGVSTYRVVVPESTVERYVSHFATCPNANHYRGGE